MPASPDRAATGPPIYGSKASSRVNTLPPFVSVIIPVFNDAVRLARCLEALEEQTYPENRYEIIVVDNGSSKDISAVAKRFAHAIVTNEDRPGSYAARNKGLSMAKGSILAFTDSDCIPFPEWIEMGVTSLLREPDSGLAAGQIKLFFKNHEQPTAAELYEKLNAFQTIKRLTLHHYGVTANLFAPKSTFDKVGLFNDSLKSGGDVEWGNRVHSQGMRLIYASEACVAHPARHSFSQLYRKTVRVEGGVCTLQKKHAYPLRDAVRDLWQLIRGVLGLAKRFVCNQPPAGELSGAKQRLKYLVAFTFVGLAQITERLRLRLGGVGRR